MLTTSVHEPVWESLQSSTLLRFVFIEPSPPWLKCFRSFLDLSVLRSPPRSPRWGGVGALRREIRSLTAPATSAPARFEGVLRVGDVVKGRHMASSLGPAGTSWYRGTIVAVHEDGGDQTVDIKYDDGDFEEHIKREYVRAADGRGRNQH